jgi:hypothetical protein
MSEAPTQTFPVPDLKTALIGNIVDANESNYLFQLTLETPSDFVSSLQCPQWPIHPHNLRTCV